MGTHTAYWRDYTRAQWRQSGLMALAIVAWVIAIVVTAVIHQHLGSLFPFVIGALLLGMVVSLVRLGRGAYRVRCPECGTDYRRSKWGGQCPSCGLKLLQSDP